MSTAPTPAPASAVNLPADVDAASGETVVPLGATGVSGKATALGGDPLPPPAAAGIGGAPRVDLWALNLSGPMSTALPAGAAPARAERVAEGAGHAVPKTPADLAAIPLAGEDDDDDLTQLEVAVLRHFLRGLTIDEVASLRSHLRNGFPGERVVTPAQAREIKGHLGGQSMY